MAKKIELFEYLFNFISCNTKGKGKRKIIDELLIIKWDKTNKKYIKEAGVALLDILKENGITITNYELVNDNVKYVSRDTYDLEMYDFYFRYFRDLFVNSELKKTP